MTYSKAYESAQFYFQGQAIICVLDAQSHWIFYAGETGTVEIGSSGIKISKETGKIEDFILPDEENFELLDRATKMDI